MIICRFPFILFYSPSSRLVQCSTSRCFDLCNRFLSHGEREKPDSFPFLLPDRRLVLAGLRSSSIHASEKRKSSLAKLTRILSLFRPSISPLDPDRQAGLSISGITTSRSSFYSHLRVKKVLSTVHSCSSAYQQTC